MIASFFVGCQVHAPLAWVLVAALPGCMPNPAWDGCLDADICDDGSFCDPVSRECTPNPGLPDGLDELPLHEWTPISRNVLQSVAPCPNDDCAYSGPNGPGAVVNGWNGGVYANAHGPLGGLVHWGAGSSNYNGNEVYFFDLETLLWSTLSEPTDGQTPGDATTFEPDPERCEWWDGTPLPVETLGNAAYASSIDAFVLPSVNGSSRGPPRGESGCSSGLGFAFSLANGTWARLGEPLADFNSDMPSAYDAERDVVWSWIGSDRLGEYAVADGTWAVHYGAGSHGSYGVATIAPSLDLFLVADFDNARIVAFSTAEPWTGATELGTVGATEIEADTATGFSWSPDLGAVVAWRQGLVVHLLHPPEENWTTEAWTWERLDLGRQEPTAPQIGPYGRFQYIEALGAAVVSTTRTEPVFAVRLR